MTATMMGKDFEIMFTQNMVFAFKFLDENKFESEYLAHILSWLL
jgi:hypothetical protein